MQYNGSEDFLDVEGGWVLGVMEYTLQRGDHVTECTPSYSIIKTAQPLSGVSQPLWKYAAC